jgi:hypothetical protein
MRIRDNEVIPGDDEAQAFLPSNRSHGHRPDQNVPQGVTRGTHPQWQRNSW